jgi:Tfp pilus assembly protein FimT
MITFKRSFTIIELIMIIVIIGILAALAIPRFSSFYVLKLDSAVKKVVEDIRYVQAVAISRHANTGIVFGEDIDTYRAYVCDSDCETLANWFALEDPFTRGDLVIDFTDDPQYSGIDISGVDFGGTNTLRFDWQGIPQNRTGVALSSEGTLTLSYRDNSYAIYVTPNTGRVRVE